MHVEKHKPPNSNPRRYCVTCGKPTSGTWCKQHYLCSNPHYSTSMSTAQRKFELLDPLERAAVERVMEGRTAQNDLERRAMLVEAMGNLEAALRCNYPCCAGKSLKDRLEEL